MSQAEGALVGLSISCMEYVGGMREVRAKAGGSKRAVRAKSGRSTLEVKAEGGGSVQDVKVKGGGSKLAVEAKVAGVCLKEGWRVRQLGCQPGLLVSVRV